MGEHKSSVWPDLRLINRRLHASLQFVSSSCTRLSQVKLAHVTRSPALIGHCCELQRHHALLAVRCVYVSESQAHKLCTCRRLFQAVVSGMARDYVTAVDIDRAFPPGYGIPDSFQRLVKSWSYHSLTTPPIKVASLLQDVYMFPAKYHAEKCLCSHHARSGYAVITTTI